MRWETDGQTITRDARLAVPAHLPGRLREHGARRERHASACRARSSAPPSAGRRRARLEHEPELLAPQGRQRRARTASGRRSRRTSRTCCARPTSCCPRAAARPFVQARGQGRGARSTRRRAPHAARGTDRHAAGTATTDHGAPADDAAARRPQEFAEQRLTFREAASVIVNAETRHRHGARDLAPAREGGGIPRAGDRARRAARC